MVCTDDGMVISVRDIQFRNKLLPSEIAVLERLTDASWEQPLKMLLLKTVTPLGMVAERREVQPLNTPMPIVTRVLGSDTEVMDTQLWNELIFRLVTPSGMFNVTSALQPKKALSLMVVSTAVEGKVSVASELQPLQNSIGMEVMAAEMVMELSETHCAKALSPMVVTLTGRLMDDRKMQRWNAPEPMVVTDDGMVTLDSRVQLANAKMPILVTPLAKVSEVSDAQPWHRLIGTAATKLGMASELRFERVNAPVPSVNAPEGSREMEFKEVHWLSA